MESPEHKFRFSPELALERKTVFYMVANVTEK